MSFRISRSPCCVIFAVLPLALAGCHLFSMSAGETSGSAKLPRLVAPRDSVQLEIVFVDRPESDPLIGEALWEKVDQIAGFSSDERNKLRKNGWRIGQCSSHPPQALEELMKAVGQPEAMDGDRRVTGRRVAIPAGGEIPIEVTDLLPELELELNGKKKTYADVKAVLRVHVDREQDGWVQLRFIPEIHHGQKLLRPFATAEDWTRRRSQNIEPVYGQQFSMNLNVGELALVTSGETEAKQLPSALFRSVDEDGHLQRLLIIRVANMRRMTPVFHSGGIQSSR
jgi:hypothetical protein